MVGLRYAGVGHVSPDIIWNEAENFPYADGNPYRGPQAIAEGVFARCVGEWEDFAVKPEELLDAGETVVALVRYAGVYKATGKPMNPQAVHVWRITNAKVTQFQQYADTLHVAQAIAN
ncbi:ketosteroid isomerase-related protein [alpha proteobacterium U9-1i]|nr:ketosteroid isomerase-related protein [alpha proteobacterium U9-1i]